MLTFDANKRIGARQALCHDYFKEYELYPPKYENHLNNGRDKNFQSSNDDNSSQVSR
jgi:hypothetical protein